MRVTVTLDDDLAALIDAERRRTGESFRDAINRLLRQAFARDDRTAALPLPLLPGAALLRDVCDTSAVLAELDDDRARARGTP